MNYPAQSWPNLINKCVPIDPACHEIWTAVDLDGAFVLCSAEVLPAVGVLE